MDPLVNYSLHNLVAAMIDVLVDLSFRMFGLFVRALFDLSPNSPQNCIKTAFSGLER